jgi:hypothetical protein
MFSINTTPANGLVPDEDYIRFHHFYHQAIEACPVAPPEVGSRLAGITNKRIDLGRAEITRVDLNEHPASRLLEAFSSRPRPRQTIVLPT